MAVRQAEETLLEKINAAIAPGRVFNRAGEEITQKIEEGLVREDGKVFYPVRNNIPVMLIEEGIELAQKGGC